MEDENQPAGANEPSPTEVPAAEAAQALPPLSPQPETPATEPVAEAAPAEEAAAPAAPAEEGEKDPLALVAEEASRRRLAPADEEKATALLKEALLDGREGVGRAIEHLPKLPWMVGVNGVTAAWMEMKPTFRTRLLAGLARIDSEPARRVRLSLARGLFKIDVPAALKIAVSVAKDLREKETGSISNRNAQIFASVFIGRAKPWVIQLPLADLKPNEAEVVLHVAVLAAFLLPHPPASQLSVLKWGDAAERLDKLAPPAIEAIKRGLSRWSGKWRNALKNEVKGLPEEIGALLVPPPGQEAPEKTEAPISEGEAPAERAERAERADRADRAEEEEEERERGDLREPREPEDDEDDDDERDEAAPPTEPVVQTPKPRPVYESKTMPNANRRDQREQRDPRDQRDQREERQGGRGPRDFNLNEALRQIEQYAQGLRSELQTAQNKLRQREDDSRRAKQAPPRPAAPIIPGEPTPDELARLNVQLEARNAELQARIDELREDAEARAASTEVPPDAPGATPTLNLPALLQLKLQEDYDDFRALESEAPDVVVQQHYRALLRHVFEVLRAEGVALNETKPAEA